MGDVLGMAQVEVRPSGANCHRTLLPEVVTDKTPLVPVGKIAKVKGATPKPLSVQKSPSTSTTFPGPTGVGPNAGNVMVVAVTVPMPASAKANGVGGASPYATELDGFMNLILYRIQTLPIDIVPAAAAFTRTIGS